MLGNILFFWPRPAIKLKYGLIFEMDRAWDELPEVGLDWVKLNRLSPIGCGFYRLALIGSD